MRKTFFASQSISTQEYKTEIDFNLEYYLLSGRIKNISENDYIECYGVEIIKKYTDKSGNNVLQKKSAENITTDKKKIFNLLRVLYNNQITPVCLCEVIDDYLSSIDNQIMKEA